MKKKTNIQLASHDACTGCAACASVCPTNSITMLEDKEGFLQPQIDADTCINCHKCEKTCPIISPITIPADFKTLAYVAINKDEAVRMRSSSGGMFHALAKWTIEQGGVVFGARFNEHWEVVHDYTEMLEGIEPFMRSKYVQSRIGDTFKQAKQFLDQGRWVLYSGTPCQIGGLKSHLHKDYDKLLAVDIVCHGVPSSGVWKQYIREEISQKGLISHINFRDKEKGWSGLYLMRIKLLRDGKDINICRSSIEDNYLYGFLNDYFLRLCCFDCHFKTIKRASDITIADAWGIEHYLPEINDSKGISLLLVHSSKGENILNNLQNHVALLKTDINHALKYNRRATTSVKKTKARLMFYMSNKYLSVSKSVHLVKGISKIITKSKRLIKSRK